MTLASMLRRSVILAGALSLVSFGCGGGGGSLTGTGGSSGSLSAPCSPSARVGGFSVQLIELDGSAPYASIGGGVLDGVDPAQVWQQKGAAAGACRLMVGPMLVCTTPCTNPQTCGGQNQCITPPTQQSAGVVTVTGVGAAPITMSPSSSSKSYFAPVTDAYPPFVPGAPVRVQAAGATIPAFTLDSVGIEPLAFAGSGLTMSNGQPFAFTWTPPAAAGAARIYAKVEIGHHGGVAAQIDCDLPDTGSAEIPAALVSALIAEGVHGFPTLSLTRRTVVSANVGAGCVDFAVAAPVERSIGVCPTPTSCIVSCTEVGTATECPASQTCKADYTCG
jgi:hypothetical protein